MSDLLGRLSGHLPVGDVCWISGVRRCLVLILGRDLGHTKDLVPYLFERVSGRLGVHFHKGALYEREVGRMQAAIVYRWSGEVPGREAASKELMNDINASCDQSVADGEITDYAWYLSAQGGIHLLIVRGEAEQLTAMAGSPEMLVFNTRGGLINKDFSWGYYATGDSAMAMADLFYETAAQLA